MLEAAKKSLQRFYRLNNIDIDAKPQSGGDIHQSYALSLHTHQYTAKSESAQLYEDGTLKQLFLKLNSGPAIDVLKSEFESLEKINLLFPGFYPKAILFDQIDGDGLLFMSFHQLANIDARHAAIAGQALAQQHKISNENFGWASNNFIGLTPQLNKWQQSWPLFFRECRLAPMLELAIEKGLPEPLIRQVKEVLDSLETLLSHEVIPSLVHGDLWSGNLALDLISQQILFYDPAPYFGDREVDLAMTKLFGRQHEEFYRGYQQVWPLSAGHEQRCAIYNLYHALNHVVLFGTSYNGLVKSCLDQIDY